MAHRIRTTVTIREDDPVPPRRSKKQKSSALVIIILVLLGLFLLSRTQRPGGQPIQPAAVRR